MKIRLGLDMRLLYSFLLYCAAPFLFLRLWIRGKQQPMYRTRWLERFGFHSLELNESIWIHAVSVGETIAAEPLIKHLAKQFPHQTIVVSTMTATGAARVQSILNQQVKHVFLPYDFNGAVQRFLKNINPKIAIIVETELWPNLIAACNKSNIPICLLNARLSEKSTKGYRLVSSLTKKMLSQLTLIAARNENDAKRFIALGAKKENVHVSGNLKFDIQLPNHLFADCKLLRHQLGVDRPIWIAASTHDEEEKIVLDAHEMVRQVCPNALLILVPRHPNRFQSVKTLLIEKNILFSSRDQNESCSADTSVYFANTMGEMLLMYGVADIAFVGGSLIPRGGHNMLEPAALQKAIITGPHLFNFPDISAKLLAANAMIKVNDAKSLSKNVLRLMQDANLRKQMGESAQQVRNENRGALEKQLLLINNVLA